MDIKALTTKDLNNFKDLFFEKKAIAHLAIVRKNNVPHVTPVWFNVSQQDFEKNLINVNSAKGRVKTNILEVGSKVSLSIVDPDNIYRYIGINGIIQDVIEGEEGLQHINDLSHKYTGQKTYQNLKPGEIRIKYIIKIENTF